MPLSFFSMSDFSVVVGVTWAALAGFGLDFFLSHIIVLFLSHIMVVLSLSHIIVVLEYVSSQSNE
jgi:hypothetical protein